MIGDLLACMHVELAAKAADVGVVMLRLDSLRVKGHVRSWCRFWRLLLPTRRIWRPDVTARISPTDAVHLLVTRVVLNLDDTMSYNCARITCTWKLIGNRTKLKENINRTKRQPVGLLNSTDREKIRVREKVYEISGAIRWIAEIQREKGYISVKSIVSRLTVFFSVSST